MSAPQVFFDSNIVVYVATDADWRTVIADQLLAAGGYLSVQVLNEFASVARRKLRLPFAEIWRYLAIVRDLCEPPTPITLDIHERALEISERYGYHIYDALMIASALTAKCSVLYSEDMQDGQRIDSLTIRNPFVQKAAPAN